MILLKNSPSLPSCYPKVASFFQEKIKTFLQENSFASQLATKMLEETGTRFSDWIDYLALPFDPRLEKELRQLGLEPIEHPNLKLWQKPDTFLPIVWLVENPPFIKVALQVDYITDFIIRNNITTTIEGSPHFASRRAMVAEEKNTRLYVVERRAYRHIFALDIPKDIIWKYLQSLDLWRTRKRYFDDSWDGMKQTLALTYRIVDMIGHDLAATAVLEVEKEYWQANCPIGDWQKFSQNQLGLGLGNYDHFVFRSSRILFRLLVQIFETLGFQLETRSYFPEENKGTQYFRHAQANLCIAAEVDLKESEKDIDFSHQDLSDEAAGNIEKWTRQEGESLLRGGIYALAIRCDFQKIQEKLAQKGEIFQLIQESSHFKKAISSPSSSPSKKAYLVLVERNDAFGGFDFLK